MGVDVGINGALIELSRRGSLDRRAPIYGSIAAMIDARTSSAPRAARPADRFG